MQFLIDALAWSGGLVAAVWLRYDGALPLGSSRGVLAAVLCAALLQAVVGLSLALYRGRYQYGSFEEVAGVTLAVGIVSVLGTVLDILAGVRRPVPASTPVAAGVVALVFMLAARYLVRAGRERRERLHPTAANVIVFGAGAAGSQLVRAMLGSHGGTYRPVALLDDDRAKRCLRIRGVPVRGDRRCLEQVARQTGAATLVIAIANADARLIRDLSGRARAFGLSVKVLPTVAELFDREIRADDVRDLQLADLLGRRQVEISLGSVAEYLRGKRVLVTGAGGSIGSELCRQIHRFQPAELIMLDRDESALHAVQLSLHGAALLHEPDVVLADIRDAIRIRQIFAEWRPEIVFHAAALKHLPLLEQYPEEAVKSNVWGTQAVLEAAAASGVGCFVNISTDKAADPASVLGYSKRLAERLTAQAARSAAGSYLSVRFGNVLGSRGSVVHAFSAQIGAGGPVTVTHPDVTRYFMTVEEAVQLVIQAAVIGKDGEALVLDMGDPVRIVDVARQLADWRRTEVEIVFTGLRPGEKLHEVLFGSGERDLRPWHPLIAHVPVPPLSSDHVRGLDLTLSPAALRRALAECVAAPRPGVQMPAALVGR